MTRWQTLAIMERHNYDGLLFAKRIVFNIFKDQGVRFHDFTTVFFLRCIWNVTFFVFILYNKKAP